MMQLMLSNCYWSSLFQGKKLSFYSGNLPQLYTLLLTSVMSCQMSKRKESKRKKCQKKKEHNARKTNWRKVMNHQNNYNTHILLTSLLFILCLSNSILLVVQCFLTVFIDFFKANDLLNMMWNTLNSSLNYELWKVFSHSSSHTFCSLSSLRSFFSDDFLFHIELNKLNCIKIKAVF